MLNWLEKSISYDKVCSNGSFAPRRGVFCVRPLGTTRADEITIASMQ